MRLSKSNLLTTQISKKEGITLRDGTFLTRNDILKATPLAVLTCTTTHLDLSNELGKSVLKISDPVRLRLFINMIAQKSAQAKLYTSIFFLAQCSPIAEINLPELGRDQAHLFPKEISFLFEKSTHKIFNARKLKLEVLKKFAINRFYRALRSNYNFDRKKLLRAWTEVNARLYPEEIKASCVYIYPFGLNLRRGFAFMRQCFANYSQVSLMGIPYSLLDCLKVLSSGAEKVHLQYLAFEFNGYSKHSRELSRFAEIYTTDDFVPGSYVLYKNVGPNTQVINRAHGIGMYNPFISYSFFYCFNKPQTDFYRHFNRETTFSVPDTPLPSQLSPPYEKLLYVDQDLEARGCVYEANLQAKILDLLQEWGNTAKRTFLLKFHPNRSEASKRQILGSHASAQEVKSISNHPNPNVLVLNLYSTAYFELSKNYDVLFVENELLNPRILFGPGLNSVHISQLLPTLKGLMLHKSNGSQKEPLSS